MFKKIVLTTDLSENAEAASAYAVVLARSFGGTIRLVLVLEDRLHLPDDRGVVLTPVQWMMQEHGEMEAKLKAKAGEMASRDGIEVVPVVLHGQPASEIVKEAGESKADCIVIATHGRTGFNHLVFGSVAEKVVRLSPCPVLTVRPPGAI